MHSVRLGLWLCCFCVALSQGEAWGQLFGARSVGRPLTSSRSGGDGVGQMQGNERYVRGNRGREFVGSDRRDTQAFVGSEQGRTGGSIVSSLAGLRRPADRTADINKPLPASSGNRAALYPPRLVVADDATESEPSRGLGPPSDWGAEWIRQLADSPQFDAPRVAVSVEGRTAILQGEVASARERDLLEILVLFEPGISQVQNRLEVRSK